MLGKTLRGQEAGVAFLTAVPDVLGSAASDLTGIGSALNQAHAAAAVKTTGVGCCGRG